MRRQARKRSSTKAVSAGGSRNKRGHIESQPDTLAQQRQLALNAAHMGWWHYDPVTLVATYDKRYTEIFGVSGCERPNEEILKLLHPEDRARVWAAVEAALDPANPKPYSAEYRVNRPDGQMVWVEAHGLATFDGKGRARRATSLVGTVADITGRKHAEAALRESHDRTSAILAGIADAFYSLDDQWRFVMVNPAAERAPLGRPASELVGKVIWDVFPKLVGTRIHQHYLDAVEKRSQEHYEAPSPLNGRWYEVFMFPRTGGLDVYLRDIDDRKQVEEALRESEERFRTIAEALPALISLSRTEDSTIVFTNTAYNEAFGFRKEEIIGRKGPDVYFDPADRAKMLDAIREQGFVSNFQLKAKKSDGTPLWLLSSVRPITFQGKPAILGASIDISERVRAEAALRASEERFKAIADNTPDHILIQDRDLRYQLVINPQMGLSQQDMIGKTDYDFLSPVDADKLTAIKRRLLETGEPIHVEIPITSRDGTQQFFDGSYVPRRNAQGEIDGLIGYFKNVTERKQAEQALEAANRQLREQDLHKNEFLAILSHELRNPLAPICNSLYILDHAPSGGKQSQHARDVIGRQVGQLARLVDDLLDVTRVSRNKIQLQRHSLELNDLVHRTVEDHRSLFEKRAITVTATLAADPLPVNGDADRLAQVLGNLLQNAAKFTSAGGRVTVSTAVAPSKTRAILRVSDTGAGIEPSLLRRLFQPFMQADATLDRSKGGLGLGLALVKGLVEMHGGEVRAHSEGVGKGSEFAVELPLDETADTEPSASPAGPDRSGRRVLVIEDNHDAADSLREVLEFGAHVVEVAYNGPDGLDRARSFKPEIVLCDIGLPGMDGYEVARAFRADPALKDVFLVALSGYALPDDLQRAREAGFEEHLAKPSSLETLEELLAHAPAGSPPLPRPHD
jgi:PAS domain S-box-containing protein